MDNSRADVKADSATSGNLRLNQSGYGIKQMLIICLVILTIANLSFPAFLGSLRVASAATLAMPATQTSNDQEKQRILEKEANYGLPIGAAKQQRPANYVAPQIPGLQVVNTFNNPAPINIPTGGAATPYPSTIAVTGVPTGTAKVTVVLNNFSHTYPRDVQVLLVGPQGQKTMVMSGAGGDDLTPANNVVLTFDDAAAITPTTPLATGTYKPVNGDPRSLPPPAPQGPYPASLAVFNNSDPNGTWNLYVADVGTPDSGIIANGWSLSIDSSGTAVTVSPTLTGISPYFVVQGSAGFSATISGTNFTATTTATVNGTVRPTTFVNANTLNVAILANDLTTSNVISVGVIGGANRFPIAVIPATVYSNGTNISIPLTGTATPYPSNIVVSGASGTVSQVVVSLFNYNHAFSKDVDILLVGPTGQRTILLSDAGNSAAQLSDPATNVTLILDDLAASTPATTINGLVSGRFKPANYVQFGDTGNDTFATPAPAGPYTSTLSVFNGTTPNGTWSLYVNDDSDTDGGNIMGGWALSIMPSGGITSPLPILTGITPYFGVVGSAGTSLTVTGSNFVTGSVVNFNGSPRVTTFVSTNTLTAAILASDLVTTTVATITVSTTPPGGGTSTGRPFAVIPATVFTNPTSITINDAGAGVGQATPYPSSISVTNQTGVVAKIVVSLFNFTHATPADVDILLVGPQGQTSIVQSDAGGFNGVTGLTLVFDDAAVVSLTTAVIRSGVFKPTDLAAQGGDNIITDTFPTAPSGPYTANFNNFNNTNPNGTWSLYVIDDDSIGAGNIAGGWALSVITSAGGVTGTNPVPTLTAISPTTTAAGSSAFTLTVTGTNFISTSVVNFGGTALVTTFVNSNTLTAFVPAALVATPSTVQVNVTNPAPGGGTSSSLPFVITGGGGTVVTPTLTAIFPYYIEQATAGFSLTVTGTNFVATSTVNFNGSPRPTTFVSANSLTAQILASDLLITGVVSVSVSSGVSATSNSLPFAILPRTTYANLTSIVITLGPTTAPISATPYPSPINVTGASGVVSKVVVSLFNFGHNFPSDVDVLLVGPQGQQAIIFSDVGGSTSVTNTTFVLDDAAAVGITSSAVLTSGVFRPGNFGTGDVFPAPAPTSTSGVGSALSVFNATDPNGTWNLYVADDFGNFDAGAFQGGWALSVITAPAGTVNGSPVITTLNPSTVSAGSAAFTLTITGSGFVSSSLVNFGGQQLVPTSVTSNTITVIIPASAVLTQGTVLVTVFNPAPGGGTSNSLVFTIGPNPNNNPLPVLGGLSPFFAVQGSAGALLTITGTGFISTSVIVFAGTDRLTTFVNTSTLTTLLTAADLTTERVISVTVRNPAPGGGTSNVLPFAVIPATVYTNTAPITINDNAVASPYPATINVAGATGVVSKVVVTLFDVAHTFLSDIDVLLVGPQGQKTLLLSDSFGNASVSATTFVFDQAAVTTTIQFFGGVLPPVNNDTATDVFPAPAPSGPYSVTLNVFNNTDPNGTWRLFVRDDAAGDFGVIKNGWALSIVTTGTGVISNTPTLIAISPISVTAGSAGISLTVTGTNFITNSVVRFSGSDRPTTFVSITGLIASLSSADFITPGTYTITVFNPGPNGGVSNALTFTVVANGACTTPYVVTRTTDDSNCGSLRFAITSANAAISGTARITITFNVSGTPAIVVVSSTLPSLSPNVSIVGTSCANPVTIQGQGTTGVGLTLSQGNVLQALIVRGFGGPQISAPAGGNNRLVCVQARRT